MTYEMKPLSCNPAKLSGLSEKLIVSHYENNYGGAVKRLNANINWENVERLYAGCVYEPNDFRHRT